MKFSKTLMLAACGLMLAGTAACDGKGQVDPNNETSPENVVVVDESVNGMAPGNSAVLDPCDLQNARALKSTTPRDDNPAPC